MPAKAGIQYSETSRIKRQRLRLLDHPPSRMMTACASAHSYCFFGGLGFGSGFSACGSKPI